MRVSDGMREETVATLRRRFAEGYLSPATLEERVDRALRARTHEALALTLADLPPEEPAWRRLLPELELAGDLCRIRDVGSTNGTSLHGRAITAARLREGDEVTFGLSTLRLLWSR